MKILLGRDLDKCPTIWYETVNEDDGFREGINYITPRRIEPAPHMNISDCRIYQRGVYSLIEYDGKVLLAEAFGLDGGFMEKALKVFEIDRPAEWKTVKKFLDFYNIINYDLYNIEYALDIRVPENYSFEDYRSLMDAYKQRKQEINTNKEKARKAYLKAMRNDKIIEAFGYSTIYMIAYCGINDLYSWKWFICGVVSSFTIIYGLGALLRYYVERSWPSNNTRQKTDNNNHGTNQ